MDEKVHVRVPIYYGRRARKRDETFTMTFAPDRPLGQGVVVSCAVSIEDISGLVSEAEALWKAEHPTASPHSIGTTWGCVGVLFRSQGVPPDWRREWANHFRAKASAIPPVDNCGLLGIPWPTKTSDNTPVDLDMILATATKAEVQAPTADAIADAWVEQHAGHERYFFENVRHGIRTTIDGLIWKRIEERQPKWLNDNAYGESVCLLREEAAMAV